ncbi:MAG: cyclic 2,3-diphosphoglycerate synthase [Candidatus Aenigmatarchaeota archaeon]
MKKRTLIMGAAGRDFHDFNTVFRGNEDYEIVAFTQTSSQNLGELEETPERKYPTELAGDLYPDGIPIYPEARLEEIIKEKEIKEVVLSYSDLSHEYVMHQASRALAAGANFRLIGPEEIMLDSKKPVIAVDAIRTGCGKSQTSRRIAEILKRKGKNVVVVREPMPYGDLAKQKVQRFATEEDLVKHEVTVEEREEYEKHIEEGTVVYAGVDYQAILEKAEKEADIILWEGGNNELPFFRPDLHFVVADAVRPGQEMKYHPGETNLRMADYLIINKENSAEEEEIETVVRNVEAVNPKAQIIHADSVVTTEDREKIEGKKVLVIEDGPTLTHGDSTYGAGWIAAKKYKADKIVDPRPYAVGSVKEVLKNYDLKKIVPAMGYSRGQLSDLEKTIEKAECDTVVLGTPSDLSRVIDIDKDVAIVNYELEEKNADLEKILKKQKRELKI